MVMMEEIVRRRIGRYYPDCDGAALENLV